MPQARIVTFIPLANSFIREQIHWVARLLREKQINLQFRTKLLLWFALITAGLTCATLLVVRHTAELQAERQVEQDARNALLTFQVVENQRQAVLSRKADLLAMLAYMRNGDATTIQDVSQDPWQSDECDLFVLADHKGKVTALHTTIPTLSRASAEEMIRRSLKEGNGAAWWLSDRRLYHVVLQPFYEDERLKSHLLGTVVVGREIDAKRAKDLGRISSSDLVFHNGNDIVITTLPLAKELELTSQLGAQDVHGQVHIGNTQFFASSVELTPNMRPALSLTVLKSYDEATASLRRLNHALLGLGLIAVLAGGALVFGVSGAFTRPLANLVKGVRAVEQGDFAYPLDTAGRDEVAQVTRAFEKMRRTLQSNEAQRQELEDQLRQAQKMDALGRLAGGVAHDFNNLLTVIKGHCDLLQTRLERGDPSYGSSEQIQKTADRAAALTRQLLAFSRRQVLQPKVLDVNSLIAEMGKLLRRLIREDIEFLLRLGESLGRVKADPGQIEQVLMNLTVNACDAMPQGGRLTIETHNVVVDEGYAHSRPSIQPGRYVMLAVSDTGQGMDAITKARIFEPFFTTKEAGKGTGLGLATVYGVVMQSDGFIWVDTAPGKGSRFEIYLPRVGEQLDNSTLQNDAAGSARRSQTVLLVEDEEEVRTLASEFLSAAGYRVLAAQDGVEGLEIVERVGKKIHLLVTDVVMPKMSGPELVKRLNPVMPNLKIIYMSGYIEQNEDSRELLEESFYLQKPFSRDMLLRLVSEALRTKPSAHPIAQTVNN
jgi:signal transduction histidine kinase/ActR/RegA family two-component response regulator